MVKCIERQLTIYDPIFREGATRFTPPSRKPEPSLEELERRLENNALAQKTLDQMLATYPSLTKPEALEMLLDAGAL